MLQLKHFIDKRILIKNCVPICQRLFYSNTVHDHFRNPRNVGSLPSEDKNVGTAVVGKAACGDVVRLQVDIRDGIIKDAKFKTFGCGSAIASTSYATELIIGKTTEEALKVNNKTIANHLNLPPIKLHCSLLAEDAIKHAIKNYQEKQLKP
ncbi:nitrogen fixation [Cryptosporidium sp. chipmunk genotype I]|uniref:nitrogen fixation n=1 Tax=Cryptosporidium sp. chipmunk genotype I TaxID=1280935 RepID=UPI00351A3DB1|nr:nitrogen fixation [Cryptosporidium sp. chipmunk genotype I]